MIADDKLSRRLLGSGEAPTPTSTHGPEYLRPYVKDAAMEDMLDRDLLGYAVRQTQAAWARRQVQADPSWLVPYDDLPEEQKEADRRAGEAVSAMVSAMLKHRR